MKLLITLSLITITIFSCTKKQEEVKPPAPVEVPAPVTPVESVSIKMITDLAEKSPAAKINWVNRGVAPKGYIKGMALVYAKSLCGTHSTIAKAAGSKDKDALAYYGLEGSAKNTYAFLIGLGMRESSGKHCTGRDASASNTTATTAEAGTFQTSYNASSSDSSLPGLLKDYKGQCFLEVFKEGVTCTSANWKSYGSGVGFDFQEKAKNCPAFGADFAAITIRVLRAHYGPINRKEVQFKQEVVDLLTQVEELVNKDKSICASL